MGGGGSCGIFSDISLAIVGVVFGLCDWIERDLYYILGTSKTILESLGHFSANY